MPNKLTDKEIVKALELCLKNECDKCSFKDSETCQIDLMKLLFDLINRLQAENEWLLQELQYPQADTVQKVGDTSNDKETT